MKRADHHLVQKVLDGDVDRGEFDRFQERLRHEPELARLYEQYAVVHHTLSEEFEGGFEDHHVKPPGRFRSGSVILAIAAMVVLAAAALWFRPWERGGELENVAVLTFSVDAVWHIQGGSRAMGSATGVSKGSVLTLSHGRAGISLEPSVVAFVEGPAEIRFLSAQALHMAQGRAYFQRGGTGGALTVTTPLMSVVDSGTEFGLNVTREGPDEIQVTQGSVSVTSIGSKQRSNLGVGDACRVNAAGNIEAFASDGRSFPRSLGRFHSVVSGHFKPEDWRIGFGSPAISGQRIEGANYTAYRKLAEPQPANGATVLLVTLEVGKPASGDFHTDGWAGLSFFSQGEEVLFFGDAFGSKPTWSLDVKQHIPVILPEHPVFGPRAVTLRYDMKTGDASLHEGGVPLKTPFCEGKLTAGIRFDEIRIGASSGAALEVNSLHLRAGGE